MAPPQDTPRIEDLDIDDTDPDALFDSPDAKKKRREASDSGLGTSNESSAQKPARTGESRYSTEEAREIALKQELESVRQVNKVIEGVVESLEKAKSNMGTVHRTVTSASTLLQTWTRILSQTEHNQRLILNPQWKGSSQDMADVESEAVGRQQALERQRLEEQARREAAARKAEEEEQRRVEGSKTPTAMGRGRGPRGRARAGPTTTGRGGTSYTGVGGQTGRGPRPSSATSRTTSGIGRGATRGRGRGLT